MQTDPNDLLTGAASSGPDESAAQAASDARRAAAQAASDARRAAAQRAADTQKAEQAERLATLQPVLNLAAYVAHNGEVYNHVGRKDGGSLADAEAVIALVKGHGITSVTHDGVSAATLAKYGLTAGTT